MRASKYTYGLLLICALTCLFISVKKLFDDGAKAFIFGYPIVLMAEIQRQMLIKEPGMANQFVHKTQFPDHLFRDVVRPNVDTLYSVAWLDLSSEPLVLKVPDTQSRYYVMPFMDAWTNVFASVGKSQTGTLAGEYLVRGPDFYRMEKFKMTQSERLSNLPVVSSPTNLVWLIGRIQTNGTADIPSVVSLQQQFSLTPLSQWLKDDGIDSTLQGELTKISKKEKSLVENSEPFQRVMSLSSKEFLSRLAALIQAQGATEHDEAALHGLHRLGVDISRTGYHYGPGFFQDWFIEKSFSLIKYKIRQRLKSRKPQENGWAVMRKDIGSYGNNYAARMGVAMIGLGALTPDEAVYPNASVDSNGNELHGEHNYRLHFDANGLPPVAAFWSLTVYDQNGFLIKSQINRYALGDRDRLTFNADGSLDILLRHIPPTENSNNWLPVPKAPFAVTLRMYQPTKEFLNGNWRIPGIEKVN